MNPAASSMIQEIETILVQNSHSAFGDAIPHYISDIKNVSQLTAESLLDCSFEEKVRNSISTYLPEDSQKLLSVLTQKPQKIPFKSMPNSPTHVGSVDNVLNTDL